MTKILSITRNLKNIKGPYTEEQAERLPVVAVEFMEGFTPIFEENAHVEGNEITKVITTDKVKVYRSHSSIFKHMDVIPYTHVEFYTEEDFERFSTTLYLTKLSTPVEGIVTVTFYPEYKLTVKVDDIETDHEYFIFD
jgi:hypothetical protein